MTTMKEIAARVPSFQAAINGGGKADSRSAIRSYPDFTDASKQADVGDASCQYQDKYPMEFKRKTVQPVRAVLSQQARFACVLQELR
jgi:hypothetical protein